MNICVIGCGYVGSLTAQYYHTQEHVVTVTTRSPHRLDELEKLSNKVIILKGSLDEAIKGQDIIIMTVAPERGGDYQKTYLDTAKQLLKKAKPHQKIIYTSSTSVYGDHEGNIVDEQTPLNSLNQNSKILAETERELLKHPNTCIFRLGEIIGPEREIKNRLKKLNGKELPGTGDNPTNVIHVDDIIKAIDLAINKNLSGIYNLCNDQHISRKKLYIDICNREGIVHPSWNPSLSSPHGGKKIVSNQKIKNAGFTSFKNCLPL